MALSGYFETNKDGASSNEYPRYLRVDWTATQSIANNSTTISYTVKSGGTNSDRYVKAGPITVLLNGVEIYKRTDRFQLYSNLVLKTGTLTIPHNSDGSKSITYSISAALYDAGQNCKCSGTITLDSIPRQADLTSAPNFNDEGNPTITYSNPAGTAVKSLQACISLDGSAADIAYRDVPMTGTSYTFNLTEAERNVLRNATTTSNSRTVKFYLVTVIGTTKYSSILTKTLTIINANPTVSAAITDSNSATVALTGSNAKFVKYHSNAAYSITATGLKGASIVSRKITVGSKSSTATSGTINAVESGTFVVTATDSRGNTNSTTITKNLVDYVKLTAAIKITNPTADSGNATMTVSGNCFNGSFGSVTNALAVKYRVKVGTGSFGSWITATATKSGNSYTATVSLTGLDYMTSYTYQAIVNDSINTVTTDEYKVRSTPVFDWDADDFNFNVPVSFQKGLHFSSLNPNTLAEDTVPYWRARDNSLTVYSTSGLLNQQPGQYGLLLNLHASGEVHQLWLGQSHGSLAHRGGNGNGWANGSSDWAWKTLLDSSNYSTYCLPATGGEVTGYTRLSNTINTIGQFRVINGYMRIFTSVENAQNNTSMQAAIGYISTNYNEFWVRNNGTGNNYVNKAWTTSSDRRMKTDIEEIPEVFIDIWEELLPKVFRWNEMNSDNGKVQFGLIAQDVIEAFDRHNLNYREYGFVAPFTNPDDELEYFAITYDAYHMLTAAVLRRTNAIVKEQQDQISEMRNEIDALKKLISESILKSEEE